MSNAFQCLQDYLKSICYIIDNHRLSAVIKLHSQCVVADVDEESRDLRSLVASLWCDVVRHLQAWQNQSGRNVLLVSWMNAEIEVKQ